MAGSVLPGVGQPSLCLDFGHHLRAGEQLFQLLEQLIGVGVNPKFRKVFTGGFKLGKEQGP